MINRRNEFIVNPRIEIITGKKLIGKRMRMSLAQNQTFSLWHSFMPLSKEIPNPVGTELFSVQLYEPGYFDPVDPDSEFEKWAAIEVSSFETIPKEMEALILTGGMYAVFLHKGAASEGSRSFRYIFGTWLPDSAYLLDDRPHFEVLGEKYKNEDPDSEEELWIPVRPKTIP